MLLNENGIRLPKNTKSAVINTHSDADGFFSGLLLYNQLIKQGIPANRININFVQYGDNDLVDKATRKNRFQAVVTSDFSAYPRVDMEQSYNGIAKTIDVENNKFIYPQAGNDYQAFKKVNINKTPSYALLSQWLKIHCPNCLLFTKPKDSSVRRNYDNFMLGWKNYKGEDDVIVTDSDYTSDHHVNDKGNLVPGKSGKIGATNYPSDTEHIATVAAQNLMGWDDIEIISRIDSASYKNLWDTITLPKFQGKDRKERLGIIVNALITSIIKSNKRLAEQLIKQSQPSLVSVYNNALKILKMNDNEIKIMNLIKEENVDWNQVNSLLATLPNHEARKVLSDRPENAKIKPVSTVDQMRAKNEKNIEREKLLSDTDFKFYGNIALFKATKKDDQPGRYLFAFLKHEGKNMVFSIRDFSGMGMIQVAASPFIKPEDKARIDLQEVGDNALNAAKDAGLFKEFSYNAVKKQSGGHKTIYNISGLNIIGNTALPPNERYEYKDIKNYEERRKALNNKAVKKALDKGYSKRMKELEGQKSESKKELVDFLIKHIINELQEKYGDIKAIPSKDIEMQ